MVDFLFALIELFRYLLYGSGAMRRNVYSSGVFTEDRPLCTQILDGQGSSPSTILGIRKLETLRYQMIKTTSLWVPSFWHNTGVWGTKVHEILEQCSLQRRFPIVSMKFHAGDIRTHSCHWVAMSSKIGSFRAPNFVGANTQKSLLSFLVTTDRGHLLKFRKDPFRGVTESLGNKHH